MFKNKVCRGRALWIAVGIMMLVLLLAGGAGAATLTVDDSRGADYTRIQDAVNAANNGDTILVRDGTYSENIDINKKLIVKPNASKTDTCRTACNGTANSYTLCQELYRR